MDYTVLPSCFRVVDKLIDGQAYGEPHKINIRPMDKGLCFDGCGFSHEEDITKRHIDAKCQPKHECLFFDANCPHKTKFCPHVALLFLMLLVHKTLFMIALAKRLAASR